MSYTLTYCRKGVQMSHLVYMTMLQVLSTNYCWKTHRAVTTLHTHSKVHRRHSHWRSLTILLWLDFTRAVVVHVCYNITTVRSYIDIYMLHDKHTVCLAASLCMSACRITTAYRMSRRWYRCGLNVCACIKQDIFLVRPIAATPILSLDKKTCICIQTYTYMQSFIPVMYMCAYIICRHIYIVHVHIYRPIFGCTSHVRECSFTKADSKTKDTVQTQEKYFVLQPHISQHMYMFQLPNYWIPSMSYGLYSNTI